MSGKTVVCFKIWRRPVTSGLFLLTHLALISTLSAADDTQPAPALKASGVFESPQSIEITPDTEQFKSLVIEKIVPHGSSVEKGEKIVWFETDAIDKQIEETRLDFELAEQNIEDARFKHKKFLETQKLDRATAERNWDQAQKEYQYFLDVDKDYRYKSAEMSLMFSRSALENAEEELNQLEKMYRADDLTEESEEIVLRRARQDVKAARFRFEGAQNQYNRSINELLPRAEVEQKEKLERARITYESAIAELDRNHTKKELELQKQENKFLEQQEKYHQLLSDREKMVIEAPISGIVLYSGLVRGALTDKTNTIDVGKTVTAQVPVVTIVPSRPLQVRLTLTEKDLPHIKPDMEVMVVPNTHPNQKLRAEVESIATVPFAPNKFDCVVRLLPGRLAGQLIPTTSCQVEFRNDEPEAATTSTPPPPASIRESKVEEEKIESTATPVETTTEEPEAEVSEVAEEKGVETVETEAEEQKEIREDPISGTWDGSVIAMGQEVAQFRMELKLNDDDTVSGAFFAESESVELGNAKFDYDSQTLTFKLDSPMGELVVSFKLSGNEMSAEVEIDQIGTISLRAVRR